MDGSFGCVGPPSSASSHGYRMATTSPDTIFTFQMGELEKTSAFIEKAKVFQKP